MDERTRIHAGLDGATPSNSTVVYEARPTGETTSASRTESLIVDQGSTAATTAGTLQITRTTTVCS